jgi:deazaflavin-dependent oxidoreductase (nitroreductase family)
MPELSQLPELSLTQKIMRYFNNMILTALVPVDRPGWVFRWIFKIPVLLDIFRLNSLIPGWMLLLIHDGRKTGRRRVTPLEYIYQPKDNTYRVISGWRGNTDWYKNITSHLEAAIKVNGVTIKVHARKLTQDEVLEYLIEILRINPEAIHIFSRWAGRTIEPNLDNLKEACVHFPGAALTPSDNLPKQKKGFALLRLILQVI